jgi:hypothetical protein
MLGKPKDKYLSTKLQALVSSPKNKTMLRDNSTQIIDVDDRLINTTDHDIKMFNIKKESIQSNYRKDWDDKDFDRISQSSYLTRTNKNHEFKKGYDY